MTRAKSVLVVLIVASLGIWGCAQGQAPNASSGQTERIKALEAKNAKLEDDFRAAAAARDQARKKLVGLEEQQRQLQQERETAAEQAQAASRERDELKLQLTARTTERDALQAQYETFRKSIRELLGQAEAAVPKVGEQPVTSADEGAKAGKS